MIRFKIDSESTEKIDNIASIYKFKKDTVVGRIAFALSIVNGVNFDPKVPPMPSDGREYTPTSNVFGRIVNNTDNYLIYKTVLDKHYNCELSEQEFVRLFKLHLADGLNYWSSEIDEIDITKGEHISILHSSIKRGLSLREKSFNHGAGRAQFEIEPYSLPLNFDLGVDSDDNIVEIKINDLREFDNRNIAISGMAGSGKTQLVKDLLFQISKNTEHELKYIFFDYKGEGNPKQLSSFLEATKCQFVDIIEDGGILFNPLKSISLNEKQKHFSVSAFVDTVAMFVPNIGVAQKNTLKNVINDLLDDCAGEYPTIHQLFESLEEHYQVMNLKQDTLYAAIQDLDSNLFNCDKLNPSIFEQSMYLNLPPALSDTLRQLLSLIHI